MAILTRGGLEADFQPNKMSQKEIAGTLDTQKVFYAFAPGVVKQMATVEDFQERLDGMTDAMERAEAAAEVAEGLVINKAGINDLAATTTEAFSGVKTEQLFNDAKTYANGLFSNVTSFKVIVSTELPTTDIQTLTIYLVPKTPSATDNYDEYMYIDNNWEHIGSTEIDLSNYYTKTEIDDIVENMPSGSGEIEVNVKYPPIPMIGAKGDGTTDDAVALQNILNLGRALYWPNGTYITSATLRPKHASTNWRGESWTGTILKLITDGIELIKGIDTLPVDGVTYSPTYAKIENMQFMGLGSSHGQIGLDLKGYMYTLDRLIITGFNQAGKIAGVYVYLDNLYFHNNNNVILFQIDDGETSNYIMTMIRLNRVTFMLNTGVCISNNNGAKGYPTIINLVMDTVGFEQCGKPFELENKVQEALIQNCWFEYNTTKPTILEHILTTFNNHYNSPDQNINYVSAASGIYAYGTGGRSSIQPGAISSKRYSFQLFNNATITNNGKMYIEENIKGTSHYLEITDNTVKTAMARVGSVTGFAYDIAYNIFVNSDGTVTHDCSFTVTASKTATGIYQITFGEEIRKPIVNVTCVNATSYDTTKKLVPNVYMTSTLDGGNYNNFYFVNKITVECRDMAASNALTDGRLMITVRPQRI